MSVRERILMLRLMNKLQKHPAYATQLRIETARIIENQNKEAESKGHGSL